MSKRRREKHDINLTMTEPGSAKKMKITSRLRKPKAEARSDGSTASSAYNSPQCRRSVQSGRHRLNNSLSESETEIIWDGNSPTAHLQRRMGRNRHGKAGDISEIVQCVNTQTGSVDSNSADMPLLGLWMTRSPSHPAVDLGVVRKSLAQPDQDSCKPKSTHRKTTGRLSLLQAELEKIANAINSSVSKEITTDPYEEEKLSSPDENQKLSSDECQLRRRESVCADKQLSDQELATGRLFGVKQVAQDEHVAGCQMGTGQVVAGNSDPRMSPTSRPKTGHFGHGQSDSSPPARLQCSTGHSVSGQSNVSPLVSGPSTSQSGQLAPGRPKSSCSFAGQSNIRPSATSQSIRDKSNLGLLVTGHSTSQPDMDNSVTGRSFVGSLAIGQSSSGQSSTSPTTSCQSFGSKTKAGRLITSKPNAYKSSAPSTTGQSVNLIVSGHFVTGQSNTSQSSASRSFTGHAAYTKTNAGRVVTHQSGFGLSSTSQTTYCRSDRSDSNSGNWAAGQSSTGQLCSSNPNSGRSVSSKSTFDHLTSGHSTIGQSATSLLTSAESSTNQSNAGCLVTVQSTYSQVSTTQSTTGHSVSVRSNTGHSVAGHPSAGHLSNSHSGTSQSDTGHSTTGHSTTGHSTTGHSTSGQSFVFKSSAGRSVPSRSVVSHCTNNNQPSVSHTTKSHISQRRSNSSAPTIQQAALGKTVTDQASADYLNSLWDDCEDLDDELLLEQLSQAEAMETCKAAINNKSPNGSLQTNPSVTSSNFQKDPSTQARAAGVTGHATHSVGRSSHCASNAANISSAVHHQSPNESLQLNKPVASSAQTNKFSLKRDAGNHSKPVTSVPKPITSNASSSANCVSVKANVGRPMDYQSIGKSLQTDSVSTNKFQFQTESRNNPGTSVIQPALNTIGASSNCVSVQANIGRPMQPQSPNKSLQTSKPATSSVPTNKFSFRRETVTNLMVKAVSSTTNAASKMTTVGPQTPSAPEPDTDPFDSSLTDDMLISMCAGLESPNRQPSTISDSKPVNSSRTTATFESMVPVSSTRQGNASGSAHLPSHQPATSSSLAHPRPPPTSTQTATSQNVCSQSEIEKKRQEAMARRKKHGNGSTASAVLQGAMAAHAMLPPR